MTDEEMATKVKALYDSRAYRRTEVIVPIVKKGNRMKKFIRKVMMLSVVWVLFCVSWVCNPMVALLARSIEIPLGVCWIFVLICLAMLITVLCVLCWIWHWVYGWLFDGE